MRGRRPAPLSLGAGDLAMLHGLSRRRTEPWMQVQRARILLAVAEGRRTRDIATWAECDPATIWRVCRRFEKRGMSLLLADEPRSGRPQQISPPAKSADRRVGLLGADRRGIAHHALDQRRPGSPIRCGSDR